MTDGESKALQAKEKAEVSTPSEQLSPGATFTPSVDIYETDTEIMLLADMPGVKASELSVDLDDRVLTLNGRVAPPEKEAETDVFREYQTGSFYRQFTVSEVIDQEKIEAALKDGVLELKLPKVQAATPRKIAVKAA